MEAHTPVDECEFHHPGDDEEEVSSASLVAHAVAEGGGGAVAGVLTDAVLYGLDSKKVRVQTGGAERAATGLRTLTAADTRGLFRGMWPSLALGTVPTFGSFFFLFAPCREYLTRHDLPELVPGAATLCAVPSSLVAVPADIVKKRLVLGVDETFVVAIRSLLAAPGGSRNLVIGWRANILRDVPFVTIKVTLYEASTALWRRHLDPVLKLPDPVVAAACGLMSGAATAFITCPLDVINTRLKAGTVEANTIAGALLELLKKDGPPALFRGIALRAIITAVGSCMFWPIQTRVAYFFLDHHKEAPAPASPPGS